MNAMADEVATIVDVTETERDWWDADGLSYTDGRPAITEAELDERERDARAHPSSS